MVHRLRIELSQKEYSALLELAWRDLRSPDQQIRFFIREAAKYSGITIDPSGETKPDASAYKADENQ
jgi:hypothetical protein